MISNSLAHAFKALIYIAVEGSEEKKIRIKDLSEAIDIPGPYAAKLLQELVKHGIIHSVKGPHGGFYLKESNLSQNLFQIAELIDGKSKYTSCLLSFDKCDERRPCPVHDNLGEIRNSLVKSLHDTKISDLVDKVNKEKAFIK